MMAAMSESAETSSKTPQLKQVVVYGALASVSRLTILQMMAAGRQFTINELAGVMRRTYRAVHKDIDVLCAAGLVTWRFGDDKREAIFFVPDTLNPKKDVIDVGFAEIRFPAGK